MSLTSHLSNARDPLSLWMRARFPLENRRLVVKGCKPQPDMAALPVPGVIEAGTKYPYNLIGTAIDYRIRLYFDVLPKSIVAFKGAKLASGLFDFCPATERKGKSKVAASAKKEWQSGLPDAAGEFFDAASQTMQRIAPAGRAVALEDEEELARYCLVLGLWEQVFRAGPMIDSPLWVPRPKTSAAEMLALATPQMVSDMCQLSRLFFEKCGDFIAMGSKVSQNPTFKGSGMVGGADADFIADSCLWDIKTTMQNKIEGDWLYQLLGYVLLDFDDTHKIREVGIYMARQGVRFRWPLGELLDTLTGAPAGAAPPLEERLAGLRQEFFIMLQEVCDS